MITKKLTLAIPFAALCSVANSQNSTFKIDLNQGAPVKCVKSIKINSDRSRVWNVLTNIDDWTSWQTDIKSSKLNGDLKPNSTFRWESGGTQLLSILHTVKPSSALGWTGKKLGITAIHNWQITESDGEVIVTVHESMHGLIATLFKKAVNANLEKGMVKWLELLKHKCEKNPQVL